MAGSYYKGGGSINFHPFFPTVVLTLSSCSNLDCSSQGPTVSLSCATEIILIPIFFEERTLEMGIFAACKCNRCCVFILTPSSLWAKQNFL